MHIGPSVKHDENQRETPYGQEAPYSFGEGGLARHAPQRAEAHGSRSARARHSGDPRPGLGEGRRTHLVHHLGRRIPEGVGRGLPDAVHEGDGHRGRRRGHARPCQGQGAGDIEERRLGRVRCAGLDGAGRRRRGLLGADRQEYRRYVGPLCPLRRRLYSLLHVRRRRRLGSQASRVGQGADEFRRVLRCGEVSRPAGLADAHFRNSRHGPARGRRGAGQAVSARRREGLQGTRPHQAARQEMDRRNSADYLARAEQRDRLFLYLQRSREGGAEGRRIDRFLMGADAQWAELRDGAQGHEAQGCGDEARRLHAEARSRRRLRRPARVYPVGQ